ncbi:S1 RNA-binding domain-containing protein [Streptomyces sp. NPDC053427]|uniref:S1 RNA-binding domain-containing protein n=1 Tax=Streptomyces sp. NPDC053427 TaxID=3365701 RepID=UPI0037CDAFA0
MPLPHVHRITKYDPRDRDARGRYTGPEDTDSDHGPVEAAYLSAVAAFAEESGVRRLSVREPEHAGRPVPPGFHDGAEVSLPAALELVRGMLRGSGGWCRLEREGTFFVHVGWDQYLYAGSHRPCPRALARTRELGLFPEPLAASPYAFGPADEACGPQRPADDTFWDRLAWLLTSGGDLVLEEYPVANACRRHRLTRATLDTVRAALAPRARLTVLRDERPLLTAVLPDSDGVLRARWRPEPAPEDARWAVLSTLHRGRIRRGTVTRIAPFGAFVDLGGLEGLIRIPEVSRRHVDHPGDVLEVGQEVTAKIIDVDRVRELVSLSLKALDADAGPVAPELRGDWLTSWVRGTAAELGERMTDFEATYGYPPAPNGIRPAAPDRDPAVALRLASHPAVAPDLATLYATVQEVSLPDIGNGYFIHSAEHVLRDLTAEGPVRPGPDPGDTAVVFGSDGGGILFALDGRGRVHRSRTASRDGAFEEYCAGIQEFLTRLRTAVAGGRPGEGA